MAMRSQSAMEYLMTYSWAVLIVAVALVALFQLGFFGGSTALSTTCLPSVGFLCSAPILMNTSGFVGATVGQREYGNLSITGTACTSSSVAPTTFNSVTMTLGGFTENTLAFRCPITTNTIGTHFTGYLWLQYNSGGQTNLVQKFAAISAAIATSANVPGGSYFTQPVSVTYAGGGTTCNNASSCTATLSSGYAVYLCGGADAYDVDSTFGWTSDQTYYHSGSDIGASVGHQSSDACAMSGSGTYSSVGGFGVSPSSYTIATQGGLTGTPEPIAWSPSSTSATDFVVISAAGDISATLPTGCTEINEYYNSGGFSSVYLAACTGESSYSISVTGGYTSSPWSIQYVVYDF